MYSSNKKRGEILTKTYTKASIAVFIATLMVLSTVAVPAAKGASQKDINSAIAKGLSYLASTQNVDGSWPGPYPVASTAMAVLAFENNGHYGWNSSDSYHNVVQNGLNWLFSQATVVTSTNPDPNGLYFPGTDTAGTCPGPTCVDVSGDGYAIGWYGDSYPVYETPAVLMAIVACKGSGHNCETDLTTTGPSGVIGRSYSAVAQDIVDWIAWAQNSVPAAGISEGGWRYVPQSYLFYGPTAGSDNSNSQWPVIGLMAAQLWGLNPPPWVATELQKWISAEQDLTGTPSTNPQYGSFGYYLGVPWGPCDTAAGILELTYVGVPKTDPRILAAEGYLYSDWYGSSVAPCLGSGVNVNCNIGSLYNMYAIMKAMRLTIPSATTFIPNYANTTSIEWYNGTNQYADALVGNQSADGHWNNWVNWFENDSVSNYLGTAWGILILLPTVVVVHYDLGVHVVDNVGNPISGATVGAVGPTTQSGTTNSTGWVQWNAIQGGPYDVTASKACYVSASQSVYLDRNTFITLTLQPSPSCISTPEFGASSMMTMIIAAFCAALVILIRPKKLRAQTNTR
jgi:hypothetical protein